MTNVFLVLSLVFVLRRLVFGEVLADTKIVGGGEGEVGLYLKVHCRHQNDSVLTPSLP